MRDAWLVANDQIRQQEGGDEQRKGRSPMKEAIQAMVVKGVITLLCGVGLYVSLFMLNKSRRASRGEIEGPSVVKTPRAHLFGVPNSLVGTLYYPAVGIAVWFVRGAAGELVLLAAMAAAAATSLYLAYSLLFITRRECPFCWTSHAVNWALLLLACWLFLPTRIESGRLILLKSASRVLTADSVAAAEREGRIRSVSSTLR